MINNSLFRLSAGIGLGAGVAIYCAVRARKRNRSLVARTKQSADSLMKSMDDLREAAAELLARAREEAMRQKKGVGEALEAGGRAYRQAVS